MKCSTVALALTVRPHICNRTIIFTKELLPCAYSRCYTRLNNYFLRSQDMSPNWWWMLREEQVPLFTRQAPKRSLPRLARSWQIDRRHRLWKSSLLLTGSDFRMAALREHLKLFWLPCPISSWWDVCPAAGLCSDLTASVFMSCVHSISMLRAAALHCHAMNFLKKRTQHSNKRAQQWPCFRVMKCGTWPPQAFFTSCLGEKRFAQPEPRVAT